MQMCIWAPMSVVLDFDKLSSDIEILLDVICIAVPPFLHQNNIWRMSLSLLLLSVEIVDRKKTSRNKK